MNLWGTAVRGDIRSLAGLDLSRGLLLGNTAVTSWPLHTVGGCAFLNHHDDSC